MTALVEAFTLYAQSCSKENPYMLQAAHAAIVTLVRALPHDVVADVEDDGNEQ
jgi:hypothetical protein